MGPRVFDGLFDTLRVLADAAAAAPPAALALLDQLQKDVESAYDSRPATLAAAQAWLARLATSAAGVAASLAGQANQKHTAATAPESDAQRWAQALTRQCRSALDELALLAPWLALPTASDRLRYLLDSTAIPTLHDLATNKLPWLAAIEKPLDPEATPEERDWLNELRRYVAAASRRAQERIAAIEGLALQAGALATMDYDFLYDKGRHLLAIGYNVGEHRQDSSYYDLLASEARLCSFRGDCAGTTAAGKLVCPWPSAH